MKVLFIYTLDEIHSTITPLHSWTDIQFGISYISSTLKKRGHQTALLVMGSNTQWPRNRELLENHIAEFQPDIIAFTSVQSQYDFVIQLAAHIRNRYREIFLLIGGVYASLSPNTVIRNDFNALCIGEGETATLELCQSLETGRQPAKIENLWIRKGDGTIEKNPCRPFNQEIDALPFPDRTMWRPWIRERINDQLSILLGRGCPYNCTYCSNHALKKIALGKYVRMRSPENIIREISIIRDTFPSIKLIYFEVETIGAQKKWVTSFCRQLKIFNTAIGNDLHYGCNFRISHKNPAEGVLAALARSGVTYLKVGLESGSERIRKKILKRNYTNSEFLHFAVLARKHGLRFFTYNMIGLPGETYQDYLQTVALNRKVQPDGLNKSIFYPYTGTQIYETCMELDVLEKGPRATGSERKHTNINSDLFPSNQMRNAYIWFDFNVYKGYRPTLLLLLRTVVTIIVSFPSAAFIFRKIIQQPILRRIAAVLEK